MAGRTPAEAILQDAISCVVRGTPLVVDSHTSDELGARILTLAGNRPVRVNRAAAPSALLLLIRQRFQVVTAGERSSDRWAIQVLTYEYRLAHENDAEILAYHWHPGQQGFDEPHLHVAGRDLLVPKTAHLPTGRVALEAFIRLAIREFGVFALKQDYRTVLERTEARRASIER